MSEQTKSKWPIGTYVCDLTFSFERFAYYVAKWLLAIFVAAEAAKGGLGLTSAEGAVMNSYLVAFTYITPIIGGYIADYWVSPRLLVPLGSILMGLGYLCAWKANGLGMLWVMIILVSIGTGCFKGNVSGVNGRLFPEDQKAQMDSVFSVQYSFVNIGSFLGTTIMGALAGTVLGYRAVFLVCAIMLFIDAIWWIVVGNATFGDAGKKPFKKDNRTKDAAKAKKEESAPLTKAEKQRVAAILIVTIFSFVFWFVWYLTYMPVYYHFGPVSEAGAGAANWALGSFTIPTAWFDSLNALCCIVLGPILAGVWNKLAQRPQGDMNMFKKTALGMILLGLCVAAMVIADIIRGDGTCSILWIVLVGVLMSLGEMVFSPLGNSFINKLSPKRLLGTLLGVWPLPIFFVGLTYGHVYNWLDTKPFAPAFGGVAIVVLACGVILWALSNKFNELCNENEE
jgi:dipeptide/tripeptide permease